MQLGTQLLQRCLEIEAVDKSLRISLQFRDSEVRARTVKRGLDNELLEVPTKVPFKGGDGGVKE